MQITDAMDTCFNAQYLPSVPAFSQGRDANGIVHGQHSTGLHFAPGTVCTFTATSEDLSLFYVGPTRVVSCTIKCEKTIFRMNNCQSFVVSSMCETIACTIEINVTLFRCPNHLV